ncbi:F-box protein At5g03100-like isoform X2 [Punica granatum]|uniref:F-box protein At5g03100-like isoform X2 n=2 Tax=Punica granatum TaxID=22663 RepID=A0A6P8CH36_PUNGR|nr:F-box protein At5g03100-like isoform X2 [Punica granatum]PKI79184.1 hypothetical protein CRG98_000476 [Punica granatum]
MAKGVELAQCSELVDRLSSLPDDILIDNILPLFPIKEAARTSILSRRWRFLWPRVPFLDLDFDASKMVAACPLLDRDSRREFFRYGSRAASDYVDWVNRVVLFHSRRSNSLRLFRIRFLLDESFSQDIDSWLMLSLEKGVEVLELDSCRRLLKERYRPCRFPSIQPRLFPKLNLLKSLSLAGVSIKNDSLEHLLLGCEFLERLHLCCLKPLTAVNVTGPVSRLQYIDLSHCLCVRSIMLSAPTPDLVSFTYSDWANPHVHVELAPRLVDLFIASNFDLFAHPLSRYVAQLQTLHLHIEYWSLAQGDLHRFPNLSGLKHLKLSLAWLNYGLSLEREDLRGLTSLIKAAPSVQHLTLVMFLRVIEIVGWRGHEMECKLAVHLIKCVTSLEKLIIDCRAPLLLGSIIDEYGFAKEKIGEVRRNALELKQALSSKVKLVVI